MSVRIGYQGIEGSFCEEAAIQMAIACGLRNVEYVPLISSKAVIDSLKRKEIDYALVASRNSIGGNVTETMGVIKNTQLQLMRADVFPIHQCLFKANKDIPDNEITKIVSHIQALNQTKEYRNNHFPNVLVEEAEDTAIAARRLADGELDDHSAVICSLKAGESYNLCLMNKNIEDRADNRTEFRLFSLPDEAYVDHDAFNDGDSHDSILPEFLTKAIIFIILLLLLWLISHFFNGSLIATAASLSGYIATVYLCLKKGKSYLYARSLLGYWKYYSTPDNQLDEKQQYHIPRIVRIFKSSGQYELEIFSVNKMDGSIQVCSKEAYLFSISFNKGKFYYEYISSRRDAVDVSGYAILDWKKRHFWSRIKTMNGNYFGTRTKEIGAFTFYRISEKEFEAIKNSHFLSAEIERQNKKARNNKRAS